MNRMIALTIALLALVSAGWWGWSNPERLPERLRDFLPEQAQPEDAVSSEDPAENEASDETVSEYAEPDMTEITEAPVEEPPQPAEPESTPAPRDAALPPETGSEMAQETERVAEAAIAAANARARAEITAEAEQRAFEEARALVSDAVSPLLNAEDFSTVAIRQRIAELHVSATPLTSREVDRLTARIETVLAEADAHESTPTLSVSPETEQSAEAAEDTADDSPAITPQADKATYIAQIRDLLDG
ncbi:hypothetical protein [Paracoccus aerodenitrificans]|uniref:hypothetical protein n=1 Tax=Paracoccus aerodenitrificans TaxID=3017781 RepID=UPI0022F131A2|nr:hypothetical protein [Paracoccus aerodenitrificans]WBU65014.1 hypothetical protein PAE61_06170 [Paracoccus aerodenitrificans]